MDIFGIVILILVIIYAKPLLLMWSIRELRKVTEMLPEKDRKEYYEKEEKKITRSFNPKKEKS